MARRATIEDILATGETELPIPGLLDAQGEPLTIHVRKVHAGERTALQPALPGHLFERLPEDPEAREAELLARQERWLKTLTPEEVTGRRVEAADFCCRIVALAALDPPLTPAQARALGDGVIALANAIIEFSLNHPAPVSEAEAAPATVAAA